MAAEPTNDVDRDMTVDPASDCERDMVALSSAVVITTDSVISAAALGGAVTRVMSDCVELVEVVADRREVEVGGEGENCDENGAVTEGTDLAVAGVIRRQPEERLTGIEEVRDAGAMGGRSEWNGEELKRLSEREIVVGERGTVAVRRREVGGEVGEEVERFRETGRF